MSGRLARVAAFFVSPAAPAEARGGGVPLPPAARVVVLGAPRDVVAVAAGVALRDSSTGLVAVWRGDRLPAGGLATRTAVRLARALSTRDLPTVARGRLAWLALPDDAHDAASAVRRASALVPGPFVTALAAARPAALETLVAEHDLAVVAAEPETALARAALDGLARRGIPATVAPPLQRGLARTLALAGLAGPKLDLVTQRVTGWR